MLGPLIESNRIESRRFGEKTKPAASFHRNLMAAMDMTLYNHNLKMIWFKIINPLPRLSPARWIPNEWSLGTHGAEKRIGDILPRLRQKWKDLTRGHEDPTRLGREVVRLHAQGLYANAVIAARRLADLQRERLGPHHPDYAAAISNLGVLLQQQGNLEEAQSLLGEALDLRRESLGESHPQYAAGLLQMADILQAKGDLDSAERLIRQALDIQRNSLGANGPALAGSLTSHALLLVRRGDSAAAEPLLRRALAIRKEHEGEWHPLYASALSNLAILLWRRGDSASAEPLLRQSLAIRNEALGPNHPDSVETREYLAEIAETARPDRAAEPKPDAPLAADAAVTPLQTLSAEYAEISRALAAASRLDRQRKAAALAEALESAERCQETLKRMVEKSKPEIQPEKQSPPEARVSRDRNEAAVRETPRFTPRPRQSVPAEPARVAAPSPARLERDPIRLQALALLDRLLKVKSNNPSSSELLASYLDALKSLRQTLESSEERVTGDDLAIVQLSHPVTALLRLAGDKNLSNQDWLTVYGLVGETFGPALATAASKGQIVFPAE